MKTTSLLIVLLVGGLALSALPAQAKEPEKTNAANVPLPILTTAESAAQGVRILRWEKEGENCEAVIEKDGKEWGYTFGHHAKWLGKYEPGMENGETQ